MQASESQDPVPLFENLNYTVTVVNRGPQSASQVILTSSPLPYFENTGVSPIPSQGTCNTDATARISCQLGTIVSGGTVTVSILVGTVQPGTVTSTFTATSPVGDPNPANNTATVVTTVTP